MDKRKLDELLDKELNEEKDTVIGDFVSLLVRRCQQQKSVPLGIALAASFDLLVRLYYYKGVTNQGWILCSCGDERYYFPFVNVCPRCALEREPFHHKAGKGSSANIGNTAVKALILFIKEWFSMNGSRLKVYKGEEPVDLFVIDEANGTILLAEVKSAPLLTLPLVITPDNPNGDFDGHESLTMSTLKGATMGLLLPVFEEGIWKADTWNFSKVFDESKTFFVDMLTELVETDEFFSTYLQTWQRGIVAYLLKEKTEPIFWLTNGCGVPAPVPVNWPNRPRTGRETISDGKTSVGLDRTDDIKKGVYQLLKLRLTPINQDYTVKIGIVSNIHALRHHEDYIEPIEDVMWLKTSETDVITAKDLPGETPVYNLFDGIITFTRTYTRDSWVKRNFDFNG